MILIDGKFSVSLGVWVRVSWPVYVTRDNETLTTMKL